MSSEIWVVCPMCGTRVQEHRLSFGIDAIGYGIIQKPTTTARGSISAPTVTASGTMPEPTITVHGNVTILSDDDS